VPYKGSLPRNALEILGLLFISMGIVRVPAHPEWETTVDRHGQNYRKLVFRQGRLVGAILVGQVEEAGRLQAAIRKAAAGN